MPMSRGVKSGIIGTVFLGMLGVAGYGAYNIYSSLDGSGGGGGGTKPAASAVETGPPGLKDVTSTADAFLSAWSDGDTAKAASLTDGTRTAAAALDSYRLDAHVTDVRAVPGTITGTRVPFTVTATEDYQGTPSGSSATATTWPRPDSYSTAATAATPRARSWRRSCARRRRYADGSSRPRIPYAAERPALYPVRARSSAQASASPAACANAGLLLRMPPSTGSVTPVIHAASVEARKVTAAAMSAGSPTRPRG